MPSAPSSTVVTIGLILTPVTSSISTKHTPMRRVNRRAGQGATVRLPPRLQPVIRSSAERPCSQETVPQNWSYRTRMIQTTWNAANGVPASAEPVVPPHISPEQ